MRDRADQGSIDPGVRERQGNMVGALNTLLELSNATLGVRIAVYDYFLSRGEIISGLADEHGLTPEQAWEALGDQRESFDQVIVKNSIPRRDVVERALLSGNHYTLLTRKIEAVFVDNGRERYLSFQHLSNKPIDISLSGEDCLALRSQFVDTETRLLMDEGLLGSIDIRFLPDVDLEFSRRGETFRFLASRSVGGQQIELARPIDSKTFIRSLDLADRGVVESISPMGKDGHSVEIEATDWGLAIIRVSYDAYLKEIKK